MGTLDDWLEEPPKNPEKNQSAETGYGLDKSGILTVLWSNKFSKRYGRTAGEVAKEKLYQLYRRDGPTAKKFTVESLKNTRPRNYKPELRKLFYLAVQDPETARVAAAEMGGWLKKGGRTSYLEALDRLYDVALHSGRASRFISEHTGEWLGWLGPDRYSRELWRWADNASRRTSDRGQRELLKALRERHRNLAGCYRDKTKAMRLDQY